MDVLLINFQLSHFHQIYLWVPRKSETVLVNRYPVAMFVTFKTAAVPSVALIWIL